MRRNIFTEVQYYQRPRTRIQGIKTATRVGLLKITNKPEIKKQFFTITLGNEAGLLQGTSATIVTISPISVFCLTTYHFL